MHWYKSSRKAGRFIGNSNNLTVYEDSFEPALVFPEKGRKDLLPGEVNFNYGPSTGGLLESVRFSFSTPGEYIKAISIDKDFKKTLHSDIRQKCGGIASSSRKDQRFPLSILPGSIP